MRSEEDHVISSEWRSRNSAAQLNEKFEENKNVKNRVESGETVEVIIQNQRLTAEFTLSQHSSCYHYDVLEVVLVIKGAIQPEYNLKSHFTYLNNGYDMT